MFFIKTFKNVHIRKEDSKNLWSPGNQISGFSNAHHWHLMGHLFGPFYYKRGFDRIDPDSDYKPLAGIRKGWKWKR